MQSKEYEPLNVFEETQISVDTGGSRYRGNTTILAGDDEEIEIN